MGVSTGFWKSNTLSAQYGFSPVNCHNLEFIVQTIPCLECRKSRHCLFQFFGGACPETPLVAEAPQPTCQVKALDPRLTRVVRIMMYLSLSEAS